MTTPTEDLVAVAIGTALVVVLLVIGALRVAAGYRRTRATLRRWGRTRLVITQAARRRRRARRSR